MRCLWWISRILLFTTLIWQAQSCDNYGVQNGSTCACPTGFGGSTCSQPACGGTIFQGSQRPLTPLSSNVANLTQAGCSCVNGWTGTVCNVCQTPNACQSAFNAGTSNPATISNLPSIQNNTLTCNTSPRVWAGSQMSCQVNNPTFQALFPSATSLNVIRTLQPALTPIPNTTTFGSAGSIYAQLFYAGVEQFYCYADSCTQDLGSGGASSDWNCRNLKCTCRPGTSFCGAGNPDLTQIIDGLSGTVEVSCGIIDNSTCSFKQTVIQSVFGNSGLALDGCLFGECVRQSVIDGVNTTASSPTSNLGGKTLTGGVIAGLAVVGSLVFIALVFLLLGYIKQRAARRVRSGDVDGLKISLEWNDVSYGIPTSTGFFGKWRKGYTTFGNISEDKVVLDLVSGTVKAGQMMAILGPSGAGKTTLVEILAGKNKSGQVSGCVKFLTSDGRPAEPRIGFVPQQDVLPPTLTVYEALLFAARLRLPENISDVDKRELVDQLMSKLGIASLRDVKIGYSGDLSGGKSRGISGGEMRRVSIGLELIARPDVLILDEPTSGLDSVSASRIGQVLHSIAHDPDNPIPVITSIHQPNSQLYQTFDTILLLSYGRALYSGPGLFAPSHYFSTTASKFVPAHPQGYNVADYLLEVASNPHVALFQLQKSLITEKGPDNLEIHQKGERSVSSLIDRSGTRLAAGKRSKYATTFLTQLQYLSGREWKILRRDKTLFLTHVAVASVLGVFCGGLYFNTGVSIAGFQSRVGCLFFLGALIAFCSLSALYNVMEIRPLFVRERSSMYYSPTAWLLSRFIFDAVPLRLVPTVIVSTITYWMAGLAGDAAHYFKFLFILLLYTLAMTLYNFLLGTFFQNGGIAILLSALSALYQMTFAGFFVHLDSIPPVLRWLQWLCPLKYTLEALAVNEVGAGLMIQDSIQGVPVNVSASLIMNLLFGFGSNNYYRDVLILFAYIAGFGLGVIGVVWLKVRERR